MKYQFLLIALLSIGLFSGTAFAYVNISNPNAGLTDYFGINVSVDGDNILIGVPNENTNATSTGMAYLYDLQGNLLQSYYNPTPQINDNFGSSVSIDGENVLIGANRDNTNSTDSGTLYLYGTNGTLLQTIYNPIPTKTFFGTESVIEGNHIVSSGISTNNDINQFDLSGNLVRTYTVTSSGSFKFLDIENNKLIIGDMGHNDGISGSGQALVYDLLSGNSIINFTNPSPSVSSNFGYDVEMDGNNVLISAPNHDDIQPDSGIVYLYDISGTLLTTIPNPFPEGYDTDQFGWDVGIDGDNIIVTSWADEFADEGEANYVGTVYRFDLQGNLLQVIDNPPRSTDDGFDNGFGYEIEIDGNTIVVGENQDDGISEINRSGSVHVFSLFTISNQASCEAVPISGSWNNNVCTVNSMNVIGDNIIINSGINLIIEDSLSNNGVITNNGIITNYGITTGAGEIINNAKMTNKCDGTLDAVPSGSQVIQIKCGSGGFVSSPSTNSDIPQLSDIPPVTSLNEPTTTTDSVEDLFASLFSNRIGENIETPTQSFTSQPSSSSGSSSSVSSSPVADFFQNLFASWFS